MGDRSDESTARDTKGGVPAHRTKQANASSAIEPTGYGKLLATLKADFRAARLRAHRVLNAELQRLYWRIGETIIELGAKEGWGDRVIERRAAEPAGGIPRRARVLRPQRGLLPIALVPHDRAVSPAETTRPSGIGTSQQPSSTASHRNVLLNQMKNRLRERETSAPSNFSAHLAAPDS